MFNDDLARITIDVLSAPEWPLSKDLLQQLNMLNGTNAVPEKGVHLTYHPLIPHPINMMQRMFNNTMIISTWPSPHLSPRSTITENLMNMEEGQYLSTSGHQLTENLIKEVERDLESRRYNLDRVTQLAE